jgi:hypothetical protein
VGAIQVLEDEKKSRENFRQCSMSHGQGCRTT